MSQIIKNSVSFFDKILSDIAPKKFMLVLDSSFRFLPPEVQALYELHKAECVCFSDFTPNPLYEDVENGIRLFKEKKCGAIVAVGGGSTIDVAKCIKLFCKMDASVNYLDQERKDSGIPLIVIPTTAGTGSESTRHAVIYYNGLKQSISHESIVPNYVILESSVLKTLPIYQKKCTMLDALCQAIESWWSVNSTDESIGYSKKAIELIVSNLKEYIECNSANAAEKIMLAANLSGKAINITATTAAHAMSYKLTSMYHLPHGHAVAICLPRVWYYMNECPEKCVDKRGQKYMRDVFDGISALLGCCDARSTIAWFDNLLKEMDIQLPEGTPGDIEVLTNSVNPVRLKNNPVELSSEVLHDMYEKIVRIKR